MILFLGMFSIHSAFAASVSPDCVMFEIKKGCENGGWLQILIGDGITGAFLSLLFHWMSTKTQKKLSTIIESQEELRNKRKDYTVMQMKTLFNSVLFTLGGINKQISNFKNIYESEKNEDKRIWLKGIMLSEIRAEEGKMGRILQSARNTLIAASDVFDPEITNLISGTITYLVEINIQEEEDGSITLPKFEVSKTKIKYLDEVFTSYSFITHSFEEHTNRNTSNNQTTQILETRGGKKYE